jgi:type II secretory pathway pseudopilin PulG
MNTNARHQYLRTSVNNQALQQQIALGKASAPLGYVINSSQRQVPVSSHTNYIPPIQSSMYVNILKSNAVGQSGYKVNLPNSTPISTKNYYPSGTRSSIRRARSGGCTAPKKKGAIQNYSLSNGGACGWGSIVRSTY